MSRDKNAPRLDDLLSLATCPPEDVQATFCVVLVETWVEQGLTYAAVSPGSRSTPLTLALVANDRVHVDMFHDERSAAFAALGFGLATGRAAALVCTSGTAAAHFFAAIIEADLSGVPLLACTTDRPPELRDVGAPQTIDQIKMFGNHVRWFHDPGVPSAANASSWQSLAARSLAAAHGIDPGPVHLNLPFRDPLVGHPRAVKSVVPKISFANSRLAVDEDQIDALVDLCMQSGGGRGVIIAGNGCGEPEVINALADVLQWPVFADSRSGCQGQPTAVIHFDSILRSEDVASSFRPQVVLRLGESPSSKVLNQWVAASGAIEVHVSERPSVYDPQHRISLHLSAHTSDTYRQLVAKISTKVSLLRDQSNEWLKPWLRSDQIARSVLASRDDDRLTDGISAARGVVSGLVSGTQVVLSSSMPIRDVEWFGGDCSELVVHANRGANGIDGVVATAIGVARGSGAPTTVLIGDVALIHDASTVASLASIGADVRIVVVDNDGGGIFHHLPQSEAVEAEIFEKVYGTPHRVDLVQWARAAGLPAETVVTRDELHQQLSLPGPRLMRVATNRVGDVAAHRSAHAAIAQALHGAIDGR